MGIHSLTLIISCQKSSLQVQDIERMENFRNGCCRPWAKSLLKNSYLRLLRIVNTVVASIPSRSDRLTEILFSSILGLGQTSNLKSRRIHLNRRDKESTSFQLGSKRRTYFTSWLN